MVLFLFLSSCGGSTSEGPIVTERIAAVESNLLPDVVEPGSTPTSMLLADRMAYYNVPGVSIAVINDGRIEWSRGYGVAEAGGDEEIRPDTLFQAASISKTLAGGAVMLLQQYGVIDIDEKANSYLRSWKIPENEFTANYKVTVRELLSHSGGTTVEGFDGYQQGSPLPSLLQILEGVSPANNPPVRVNRVPGTQFQYSGGGMEILHLLVEDVTGMSFRQFVKENIFLRLGMTRSDYYPDAPALPKASGHYSSGHVVPGGWYIYPESAAAGLWTTASDLARYAISIQSAAMGDPGSIFLPETAREMLTPQIPIKEGSDEGLSIIINGQMFGHAGSNEGFKLQTSAFSDRGQGAVVLTNGENGTDLINEILRGVSKVYGWSNYKQEGTE